MELLLADLLKITRYNRAVAAQAFDKKCIEVGRSFKEYK